MQLCLSSTIPKQMRIENEKNEQNSKCYRFRVQNFDGEPYMLYTYGISKRLINVENRKMLDLADYQKFLLDYPELEDNDVLPLGITADGHFIGKDISYVNKSNDSIFITGQSGKGKTFCGTNLLPSLAMLGNRILALDVSSSFTKEEMFRAHTKVKQSISLCLTAYNSEKGVTQMKETIHTKNTFKSADTERLRKTVTEKMEKLVNAKLKKAS